MKKVLLLLTILYSSLFVLGQEKTLDSQFNKDADIKYIAFTPSGGWCFLIGNNGFAYDNIPQGAIDKLYDLYKNKSTINCIAFSNNDGCVIIYDTYGYWYHNIPQTAIDKLKNLNANKKEIKQITFTPANGWCILQGKNGYWYSGIPKGAITRLAKVNSGESKISNISFYKNDGWCVINGNNGYSYDHISSSIGTKLKSINTNKGTIKQVSFSNSKCFILYDKTYWTYNLNNVNNVTVTNYAPEIIITTPDVSRGFKVVEVSTVFVSGQAKDTDGIYKVTVNGYTANLQSGGYFSVNIPLNFNDNTITVKAFDNKMKSSTKSFVVNRKKKEVIPVTANEKRVALIFGNSNYMQASSLGMNPINDATDIASALRSIGFKVVLKTNASLTTMNTAIRNFGRQNTDADVALFYFAGHGMQLERINYLLPVNANIKSKNDVSFESISVATVQKIMETSNPQRLNLIVLDACRNNPFRSWERGGDAGLADMTPPSGTLIAFATSPGTTAANGNGRNGLYTGELIKQLIKPQRIEDVFINTRVQVERKSGGQQSPWELARLRGKYFLVK